jgi:hypothetical protein
MNAVLMDDVVIGDECFVGAMSFLKARTGTEPRSVWVGDPAKRLRDVTDEELEWKSQGTAEYLKLADDCHATMRICDPLSEIELERPMTGGRICLLSRPAMRLRAISLPAHGDRRLCGRRRAASHGSRGRRHRCAAKQSAERPGDWQAFKSAAKLIDRPAGYV